LANVPLGTVRKYECLMNIAGRATIRMPRQSVTHAHPGISSALTGRIGLEGTAPALAMLLLG